MKKNKNQESALRVNSGIEQPPSVDPGAALRFVHRRRPALSASQFADEIRGGNRTILSQAITLIESRLPGHREKAQEVIRLCLPDAGKAIRIGITGVPGVGKSSFIESIGSYLTANGHRLAVLAIDPSSERSGGSILGDKTRMERLAADPNAFIRPSPSGGSLGGVARKTRESLVLCEAAGFDVIFIETVGVGQSEVAVHSMVDFFLLLMLAGAGDELQGIKRGIMEMADLIAITKADGDNIKACDLAVLEYRNALHLFPRSENGWDPRVITVSARENRGIEPLWATIREFEVLTRENGHFEEKRRNQSRHWMMQSIQEQLIDRFYQDPVRRGLIREMEELVLKGEITPFQAAQALMDQYREGQ
ncbi:MAG: methylmalonyl Co-A mutase-associated GTPase MeaB [Bacteroidales bacterium]